MEDTKTPHPIVKYLFIVFLIGFFGGGLLLFVNLFVPFLDEGAIAIIGLCVGSFLVVGTVVGWCIQVITGLRRLTPKLTEKELEAILDEPTESELDELIESDDF